MPLIYFFHLFALFDRYIFIAFTFHLSCLIYFFVCLELKDHELMNLFASENIEDDVIPALEMAM